jgi:hypothetical protein
VTTPTAIIERHLAELDRSIAGLRLWMNTGTEIAANGDRLARALHHKEILEAILKEIEQKRGEN